MSNREIKFRQRLTDDTWHYWGFISEGHFVSPVLNQETYQDAIKYSYQYTGLKDKNGKEIYEGDIVERDTQVWTVQWDNETASFTPLNFIKVKSENYKIIGNIYENKDLLK